MKKSLKQNDSLLVFRSFPNFQRNQLISCTLDDLFKLQACLFSNVKIDALIHGNYLSSEAIHLVKTIENCFEKSTYLPLVWLRFS